MEDIRGWAAAECPIIMPLFEQLSESRFGKRCCHAEEGDHPHPEQSTRSAKDHREGHAGDVADDANPIICEIGAGTGYYLSHTLDSVAGARGIGIDVSVHAAKHLARCHPRLGAVVADAWARLPIQSESVDAITVIFAPRNATEFARILKPKGQVIVLTADTGHLAELREPLGIIDVEEGKVERMIEQAAGHLQPVGDSEPVEFEMMLDQQSIASQIGMSPSARHLKPEALAARIEALPEQMKVTARARITRLGRIS